MAWVLRRALFWRVYLTLLASLVAVVIIASTLWHFVYEASMGGAVVVHHAHMLGLHRRHPPHILRMLVVIAAVVGLAAYPVVSRLTRRLEQLRASVDAWGAGRLDSRAQVEGGDEIAAVARSFNAAADRIEGLLAAHKSLLAHASHELRSPLARLRLAVEMYAGQTSDGPPDPKLTSAIVADIGELDALVDEILLASRLDQAPTAMALEPVDLLALAAEEAARAGASVSAAQGDAYTVQGSPRLLRRLVRNLLDNAAKHGRPPIAVDLTHEADRVVLAVRDQGPGIPEDECERVFEPFYRPSGRGEAAGGWGLGLSIVRRIAGQHEGAVVCRPGPGGGFIVTLPAR